jgi:hypothetical protein
MKTKAQINYTIHGTARVAIIACPKILGKRLGYLSTKGEYSWAIRDFITGVILRSGDSELTLSEIEAMVTDSKEPAYRSVGRVKEWKQELEDYSKDVFGPQYDPTAPPDPNAGRWKRL